MLQPSPDPIAAEPQAPAATPRRAPRKRPTKRTRKAPSSPGAAAAAAATAGIDNKTRAGKPSKASKMEDGLTQLHIALGAMMTVGGYMLGQPRIMATGQALDMQAEACAAALAAWADTNDRVRKALEQLTTAGGGLLVLTAYMPVVKAAISGQAPEGALPDPLAAVVGGLDLDGLGNLAAMFQQAQNVPGAPAAV